MKTLALHSISALVIIARSFAGGNFNDDWKFSKGTEPPKEWESVQIPHTAQLEPYVSNNMWMGQCSYQKEFAFDPGWENKKVFIEFEGAMGIAKVSLNGKLLTTHYGGYMGFQVDLTEHLDKGRNLLEVALDNKENDSYPPGKEYRRLDFSWFSGLYRNVHLQVCDKLYISNAIAANQQAGGGIFVTYPQVSEESAEVSIKTHVVNAHAGAKSFFIEQSLWMGEQKMSSQLSDALTLQGGSNQHFCQNLKLARPNLWSPQQPHLYTLRTRLLDAGKNEISSRSQKIGVRSIAYAADGFYLNGKKLYQRGTNRHQEYPYVGYAISDEAQYRDAVKIKEAGFDMVRLSHYPQSPAFMRACDELGLMVIDCITGWQFFKDGEFAQRSVQEARELIRRDRNHPCVVLWETSLNESPMPAWFIKLQHELVDQEYPGDQSYSGSWKEGPHDVFLPARQHAKGPVFWDKWERGNKALFTAEYGDWEYYAQAAANFNQDGAKELKAEERTSRQLRKHGEARLLQMAMNFQESHNQNMRGKSIIGDANWLMFDYNRGYAKDHCTSGVMDLMRLPKFAYYFYRSQRSAGEKSDLFSSGPMVFAATYWNDKSSPKVRVFSNCDTVTAYLNGKKIATRSPDNNQFGDKLKHPPFTYDFERFTPGELKFVGEIDGEKVVEHSVRTPEAAVTLKLSVDESGKPLVADGSDLVFVYASVVDSNGTVVPDATAPLTFEVEGGSLVGPATIDAEAGINGVLVRADKQTTRVKVKASSRGLAAAEITIPTSQNRY